MKKNEVDSSSLVLDSIEQITLGRSQLVTEVLSNMDWSSTPYFAVVDKELLKPELKAFLNHREHESLGNLVGMTFGVNPVLAFLANDEYTVEALQGVRVADFGGEPQNYVLFNDALYRRSVTLDAFNDEDWQFDSTSFSDSYITALWRSRSSSHEVWIHLRCPDDLKNVPDW